jgi:DNA-binding transcriptional regulator LsrR (DeoR family)
MLIAGGTNKTRIIAAALLGRVGNVLVSDEKTVEGALEIVEREG